MTGISFLLRVATPPPSLPHLSRAEEIKQLPQFVSVEMRPDAGVVPLVVGADTPVADLAGLPWLELNQDGSPKDLKIMYQGQYLSALPSALVEAQRQSFVYLSGAVNLTFNVAANVLVTAQVALPGRMRLAKSTLVALVSDMPVVAAEDSTLLVAQEDVELGAVTHVLYATPVLSLGEEDWATGILIQARTNLDTAVHGPLSLRVGYLILGEKEAE